MKSAKRDRGEEEANPLGQDDSVRGEFKGVIAQKNPGQKDQQSSKDRNKGLEVYRHLYCDSSPEQGSDFLSGQGGICLISQALS